MINETYLIVAVTVVNVLVIAMALVALRDTNKVKKATDQLIDLAKNQLK